MISNMQNTQHMYMHACAYSELCAAHGDEEENPFPQHRPSYQDQPLLWSSSSRQDSEASEHGEGGRERDTDQQWIISQLETWER